MRRVSRRFESRGCATRGRVKQYGSTGIAQKRHHIYVVRRAASEARVLASSNDCESSACIADGADLWRHRMAGSGNAAVGSRGDKCEICDDCPKFAGSRSDNLGATRCRLSERGCASMGLRQLAAIFWGARESLERSGGRRRRGAFSTRLCRSLNRPDPGTPRKRKRCPGDYRPSGWC